MRTKLKPSSVIAAALLLTVVQKGKVRADDMAFTGWTHQKFSLLGGNSWRQAGRELSVESNGTVSLLWQAKSAS